MYNIVQLNDKDLSELQSIAKELGIKNVESLKKDQLVYSILDEQAIVNATKKAAANDGQPRKRSRISVKKEGDKVYTASKDKATKLEAKTPDIPAKVSPFNEPTPQPELPQAEQPVAEVKDTPTPEDKPQPKKRGRKSNAQKAAEAAAKQAAEAQANAEETTSNEATATPTELPEIISVAATEDFITIEDLPSEKIELPSELIGKFEATKVEAPVNENKNQPRNFKNNNQRRNFNDRQQNNPSQTEIPESSLQT